MNNRKKNRLKKACFHVFSRKSAAPVREVSAAPAEPEPERKSFFKSKTTAMPASKTISIPMAQKQVKVIVLEPVSFDDSQKIADYLNGSQPVVVNFEATDKVVMKEKNDRLYQRRCLCFGRQHEKNRP